MTTCLDQQAKDLLPQKLSEAQMMEIIQDYLDEGLDNLGQIMKRLKDEHTGRYDGAKASQIVREML